MKLLTKFDAYFSLNVLYLNNTCTHFCSFICTEKIIAENIFGFD